MIPVSLWTVGEITVRHDSETSRPMAVPWSLMPASWRRLKQSWEQKSGSGPKATSPVRQNEDGTTCLWVFVSFRRSSRWAFALIRSNISSKMLPNTKRLLIMFWIVTSLPVTTTSQCEESTPDCTGDVTAYLQSRKMAEDLSSDASHQRSCEVDEINSGICNATASQPEVCSSCTSAKATVPTNASRFPGGSFLCENTLGSSGSACQDSDHVFTFDEPNDFLVCRGQNTCGRWPMQNVGAVCCSNPGSTGSCQEANISLAQGQGSCINDMCCDGTGACQTAEVKQANSLSCRGALSCSSGVFDAAQNLYCNSESLLDPTADEGFACSQSQFTFTTAGDRCLVCLGRQACQSARFFFNGGTVFNLCNGNEVQACQLARWTLSSQTRMRLECRGTQACYLGRVTVPAGACRWMNVDVEAGGSCYCELSTSFAQCPSSTATATHSVEPPESCVDDSGTTDLDRACCAGNAAAADPSPQCSACGCTASGEGVGDPHVYALDGQHYLLLQQGTFSFWHFSGLEAELSTKNLVKKSPVEFSIYAHYAGHASYTKGLLLVDSSGGEIPRQVLEITSEDCQWRSKQPGTSWNKVDAIRGFQTLSLPDLDGDEMTAFQMVKPAKGKMHVELLMKQSNGSFKNIGKVFVHCRPHHFINTKVSMLQQDVHLVEGQLGPTVPTVRRVTSRSVSCRVHSKWAEQIKRSGLPKTGPTWVAVR